MALSSSSSSFDTKPEASPGRQSREGVRRPYDEGEESVWSQYTHTRASNKDLRRVSTVPTNEMRGGWRFTNDMRKGLCGVTLASWRSRCVSVSLSTPTSDFQAPSKTYPARNS